MNLRTPRRLVGLALRTVLLVSAVGCAVGYGYGPAYYDTQRCQWQWVTDGFGGYQQLHCWNPSYNGYRPYVVEGAAVRVYPNYYAGPRVRVAPAPPAYMAMPAMPPPRPPMPAMPARPAPPMPAAPPVVGVPVH